MNADVKIIVDKTIQCNVKHIYAIIDVYEEKTGKDFDIGSDEDMELLYKMMEQSVMVTRNIVSDLKDKHLQDHIRGMRLIME